MDLKIQRRSIFLLGLTTLPQRGNPTQHKLGLFLKLPLVVLGWRFLNQKGHIRLKNNQTQYEHCTLLSISCWLILNFYVFLGIQQTFMIAFGLPSTIIRLQF